MQRLFSGRYAFKKLMLTLGLAALMCLGLLVLLSGQTVAQDDRPPSVVLIQQAYHRGEIDYETALMYQVYTVFAPERLPAEFQSDTPFRSATMIFAEVRRAWPTLSPQTQKLLAEFLTPPPAPGEVAILAQDRPTIDQEQTHTTTHFVIHYTVTGTDAVYQPDVDLDPANGVPDYVDWVAEDVETVWAAQIDTMGWLQPPPDDGEGGDARYDVYLKNIPPYYGYTEFGSSSFVGDNPNSPGVTETDAYYSFLALENDFSAMLGDKRELIQVTVAHEFNHAIQLGYDGSEALWLMEATSTWMEDEVYDDIDDNYQFLKEWFDYPDVALDTSRWAYHYGRWIFVRYLAEHHGGQATVRRIWEHSVLTDSVDAVSAALVETSTDFETVFGRFAAANYALSPPPQNAPYTYEEADGYRIEVGGVYTEGSLTFDGTPVSYDSYDDGNEHHLEKRAAEYWLISTTQGLSATFQGNAGIEYIVYGALREGDRTTIRQMTLTNRQGFLVLNPAAYDEVALIVANVGGVDETAGYTLSFDPTSETPPEASFFASPASGAVDTQFDFDASGSSDDETPANQLEVRWDWEGDAVWDTGWSTTKTITHTFDQPGSYDVALEVRDTVNLRDVATQTIVVSNTAPTAAFSVLPTVGTTETAFQVDASTSIDTETPASELEVRWDWENDGSWDTGFATTKQASHTYGTSDTYKIVLEVRDGQGLTDTAVHSVTVQAVSSSHPPTATFTVSPPGGTIDTVFTFDASDSEDEETPTTQLQVRWDWENDGLWDTDWSTTKTITNTFASPGDHTIALLVRDEDNLEDGTTRTVNLQAEADTFFLFLPTVLRGYLNP